MGLVLLLAMMVAGALVLPASAAVKQPRLLLDVGYETGTLDSGIPNLQATAASAPDAAVVSTAYARTGQYSIAHKVVLDDPAYVSAGAPRSESATDLISSTFYSAGLERRYEFSFLLANWQPWDGLATPVDIIWQFKRFGAAADMFVAVKRNSLVLRYDGSAEATLINDVRPYINQWVDVRIDVLWAATPSGWANVQVRLPRQPDYAPVFGGSFPTLNPAFTSSPNGYLKWGLYRPDSSSAAGDPITRIVYHDDIRVFALPPGSS
jgi:Polysaccharide lyase